MKGTTPAKAAFPPAKDQLKRRPEYTIAINGSSRKDGTSFVKDTDTLDLTQTRSIILPNLKRFAMKALTIRFVAIISFDVNNRRRRRKSKQTKQQWKYPIGIPVIPEISRLMQHIIERER